MRTLTIRRSVRWRFVVQSHTTSDMLNRSLCLLYHERVSHVTLVQKTNTRFAGNAAVIWALRTKRIRRMERCGYGFRIHSRIRIFTSRTHTAVVGAQTVVEKLNRDFWTFFRSQETISWDAFPQDGNSRARSSVSFTTVISNFTWSVMRIRLQFHIIYFHCTRRSRCT